MRPTGQAPSRYEILEHAGKETCIPSVVQLFLNYLTLTTSSDDLPGVLRL